MSVVYSFMEIRLSFIFVILVLVCGEAISQPAPVFQYSFDQCGLEESNGQLSDLVVTGNINCVCGPVNDAPEFDGSSFYQMPVPGSLLVNDFSLSFYIKPEESPNRQSLFTNARDCTTRDSLFMIQYLSINNTVTVEMTELGGLRAILQAPLDPGNCWQHVVLVKDGRIILLYMNGELIERFEGDQAIDIFATSPFLVGGVICPVNQNIDNYKGVMDEISWYDVALGPLEVASIFLPVDEILTQDTLIFLGDSFIPNVSPTCASSVSWSPGQGLSNSQIIDPTIGPLSDTKYVIEFVNGRCTAIDSITVRVIDSSQVDCSLLMLPSAFTPNGDNVNDTYGISNHFIVDNIEFFQISDRSGNTLFEANRANSKWDGTYRGTLMPAGSYIYKIIYTCSSEEFSKVGSFNILR